MNTTTLKPPHSWVGGKSRLSKQIVGLLPEDHDLYVEVFGGALNVLYAKELPSRTVYREIVNDFNSDLVNLHRAIRTNPEKLEQYTHELLISREIFEDIKHGKMKPRDDIERASFFFYLLKMSFGGKRENFAMNAKSRRPQNIYLQFKKWSERLKRVTIENMDFEKLIKTYDTEEALFYLDPPYVETERFYNRGAGFGAEDHKRLNEALKQIKGRFLLSYNDHPLIRELYKDFKILESDEIEYTLGSNVHKRKKKIREIFVMNY